MHVVVDVVRVSSVEYTGVGVGSHILSRRKVSSLTGASKSEITLQLSECKTKIKKIHLHMGIF